MATHVGATAPIHSGVAAMMTKTSHRSRCAVSAAVAVSLAPSSRLRRRYLHSRLGHLARQHLAASVRVNGLWRDPPLYARTVAAIPTMTPAAIGVLW